MHEIPWLRQQRASLDWVETQETRGLGFTGIWAPKRPYLGGSWRPPRKKLKADAMKKKTLKTVSKELEIMRP